MKKSSEMNSLGIILTLLSAFCHASWNLMGKSTGRPLQFMRLALFWSAVCYFPLFVVFCFFVDYTPAYLYCILGSGLLVGAYFYTLSRAYEQGDASVVYPLARSFPLIVLAAVVAMNNQPLNFQAALGVVLIVVGGFLLPLKHFRSGDGGFHIKSYFNFAAFMAVLAAIFTAGFSLVDKYAAADAMPAGNGATAIMARVNYVYCQNLFSLFCLEAIFRVKRKPPLHVSKTLTIPAGMIFLVSYSLIIAAMATNPVAYVVSLRQLSIVITAIISMAMLEKKFSVPRIAGVLIIFAGVVLVGLA